LFARPKFEFEKRTFATAECDDDDRMCLLLGDYGVVYYPYCVVDVDAHIPNPEQTCPDLSLSKHPMMMTTRRSLN
jgi:hypothetical protein